MIKRFLLVFVLLLSCPVWAMSVGERRALTAPNSLDENMPQLVFYLTNNISDQTEQAKAIAVWIAANILYDRDTYDNGQFRRKTTEKEQSAKQVLKDKIGVCSGFADLYEKMLQIAGIKSEKIYGFVVENAASQNNAKMQVKKRDVVGHVWTKVSILGRTPLYVDTTWMSRGNFKIAQRRSNEQRRKREIRQNKREHKTHNYSMDYFDFSYGDLMRQGEYRFTEQQKLIKK